MDRFHHDDHDDHDDAELVIGDAKLSSKLLKPKLYKHDGEIEKPVMLRETIREDSDGWVKLYIQGTEHYVPIWT